MIRDHFIHAMKQAFELGQRFGCSYGMNNVELFERQYNKFQNLLMTETIFTDSKTGCRYDIFKSNGCKNGTFGCVEDHKNDE